MGLLSSLSSAVSGLNVNQQNLNILSQNIANVNTPGYSTQVAQQQASYINGQGQGASIAGIARKVSDFLTAQIRVQSSLSTASETVQNYYQQIENLLGQPGGTNSLDQNTNAFFAALQTMANTPSVTAQTTVVNSARALATQISGLATSAQNLRLQADKELESSVNNVNSNLKKLFSLNVALQRSAATNENQSGLLDARDATLTDLSKYIDIQTLFADDGSVNINTGAGFTLLGGNYVQFSYQSAGSVETYNTNGKLTALTATAYDQDGATVGKTQTIVTSGTSGTNGSDSTITSTITGGKMSALIQVRDQLMPKVVGQLDQFAATIREQFNTLNNSGVSVPSPNSYTGERLVGGSQLSTYSGSMRIALTEASGAPVASPYADEPNGMQPLNLDLSTIDIGFGPGNLTNDGLINVINQYFGQPQPKYETGDLNNVQLALDTDSVPGAGNQISFDFSLNNISKNSASFFVTGTTVSDSNGNVLDANPATTLPSITLDSTNTYQTTAGSNFVTLTASGSTSPAEGEVIYLNAPSPSGTVGGIPTASLGGYFTVKNVVGNTFQIEVTGLDPTSVTTATLGTTTLGAGSVTGLTQYASAGAGQTVRTGSKGLITANVGANANSPYYTVTANIATIDTNGNVLTSTVSYRVGAGSSGLRNDLFGVKTATGSGTIVQPTSGGAALKATLVDANGIELSKINGVYGTNQGYLKIAATNGNQSVVIDSLSSKQLGTPNSSGISQGTNLGFASYFGLNNFFVSNKLTATGDTVAGSALNLAVTSRLTTNPTLISVASLVQSNQSADPAAPANYTYRVNSGDNALAQKMAALSSTSVNFAAAGGLPNVGTSFSQYAGLIIAQTSTNLTNATNASTDNQTLLNGFTKQSQDISGVNLDQELANTVVYQNAYGASARVITVLGQLFQELLGILG